MAPDAGLLKAAPELVVERLVLLPALVEEQRVRLDHRAPLSVENVDGVTILEGLNQDRVGDFVRVDVAHAILPAEQVLEHQLRGGRRDAEEPGREAVTLLVDNVHLGVEGGRRRDELRLRADDDAIMAQRPHRATRQRRDLVALPEHARQWRPFGAVGELMLAPRLVTNLDRLHALRQ